MGTIGLMDSVGKSPTAGHDPQRLSKALAPPKWFQHRLPIPGTSAALHLPHLRARCLGSCLALLAFQPAFRTYIVSGGAWKPFLRAISQELLRHSKPEQ